MRSLGLGEKADREWWRLKRSLPGETFDWIVRIVEEASRRSNPPEEESRKVLEYYFILGGLKLDLKDYTALDYEVLGERLRSL